MSEDAYLEIQDALRSGALARGPAVQEFERKLQEYIGNRSIISTGDISSSIVLGLFMAGVRPDDEVIASPMACIATNMPVLNLFARLRWCDIDPETGNIDPASLERCVTDRTKAILVYHWAGYPVDLDSIYDVARRCRLKVIEDAGEALGAVYKGRMVGNTGSDYTVFSFYANRQINTIDGAAIAFANAAECERGRWLKRYGIHEPSFRDEMGEINPGSEILEPGYNTCMNNIAAAIGCKQMEALSSIVSRHYSNGCYYDESLRDIPGITLLKPLPHSRPAYWVYTILAEKRDDLLRKLRKNDIYASRVHIRNDFYSCFNSREEVLPGVDFFNQHTVSIPCGWWVSESDRDYISRIIKGGW